MEDADEKSLSMPKETEMTAVQFAKMEPEKQNGMVSLQEYAAAVAVLVEVAQQVTSGGRAAAQVLLSAYNGSEWQLDITDLNNLGRFHFEAAMTVIRGRHDTWAEPHTLIPNGPMIFDELWKQWSGLHVAERGEVDCVSCDGRGVISLKGDGHNPWTPCQRCQGRGRVSRCQR